MLTVHLLLDYALHASICAIFDIDLSFVRLVTCCCRPNPIFLRRVGTLIYVLSLGLLLSSCLCTYLLLSTLVWTYYFDTDLRYEVSHTTVQSFLTHPLNITRPSNAPYHYDSTGLPSTVRLTNPNVRHTSASSRTPLRYPIL